MKIRRKYLEHDDVPIEVPKRKRNNGRGNCQDTQFQISERLVSPQEGNLIRGDFCFGFQCRDL